MSAWRRQALDQLPECRRIAEAAENPMALWIELSGACEDAYARQDEDLIRRFYEYARWCWKSPSDDVRTAVACAFYEHLPMEPTLRRDLPRRIGRAEFAELREQERRSFRTRETFAGCGPRALLWAGMRRLRWGQWREPSSNPSIPRFVATGYNKSPDRKSPQAPIDGWDRNPGERPSGFAIHC